MSIELKTFDDNGQKTVASNLNQVIDVIQEDMSGSATRRKYQTFVTGGIGVGVTSSLYQTVYDQDFSLQTANPVLDMTVGLFHSDNGVGVDQSGSTKRENLVTQGTGYKRSTVTEQIAFDHLSTMMMREKINIYRQYAAWLLGDPDAAFSLDESHYPNANKKTGFDVRTDDTIIDAALFINIKRLFKRDGIRKETFALRLYKNAPKWDTTGTTSGLGFPYDASSNSGGYKYFYAKDTDGTIKAGNPTASFAAWSPVPTFDYKSNLFERNITDHNVASSETGVQIIADLGASSTSKSTGLSGDVALLKLASDSKKVVGLIFYQAGIVVLNLGGSSCLHASSDGRGNSHTYHKGTSTGGHILLDGTGLDVGLGQGVSSISNTNHVITPVFEVRDPIHGIISGMDDGAGVDAHSGKSPLGTKSSGQVYIGGSFVGANGANDWIAKGTSQSANSDTATNSANGPDTTKRIKQNNAGSMEMGPATFYPDLLVSASIDDIVDHIGYTRFSSGSLTSMAFQNTTKINSSIYFCRAGANEFNWSSNPSFVDANGKAVMLQDANTDKTFTYITTVALCDESGDVVAIAKLNRPIEKNDESELTIRVRLDF